MTTYELVERLVLTLNFWVRNPPLLAARRSKTTTTIIMNDFNNPQLFFKKHLKVKFICAIMNLVVYKWPKKLFCFQPGYI